MRHYLKAPAFSFSKLNGMDSYLLPEMKLQNYGIVVLNLADEDKEALMLVKRFYDMGFNI